MDPSLYQPLFIALFSALCLVIGCKYITSSGYVMQEEGSSVILPVLVSVLLIFWLGNRPVNGYYFGDTSTYGMCYVLSTGGETEVDWSGEWIWALLTNTCKNVGFDVFTYFTIVEAGYTLTMLIAVFRLFPNNTLLAFLFVISSLSYYTYGINGIRNGLACHIVILAITFLIDKKYIVGAILFLTALGIHRSTMLPIAATVVALLVIKDPRLSIYFWVASIGISLVAGGAVTSFFDSLGFDDRMTSYTQEEDMSQFSKGGFRWDFLLYSAMPVVMAWYVCIKERISDSWYNVIVTVYCLSNAFWIMVIRSSFSNRFAYLSWFIYPIVIAYPLIKLPVWDNQDERIGQILLAYCGFTVFMQVFVWGV